MHVRVTDRAREPHKRLRIVDLHADTLLWDRNLLDHGSRGHVDIPRLIEGNVALQAFTVVTTAPRGLNMTTNEDNSDQILLLSLLQRWPSSTWRSPKQRALHQARRFEKAVAASKGALVWIRTSADLTNYLSHRRPDQTAGFLGIEGAQALEGNVRNLQDLADSGFRMLSLTHFTDTVFAGSATGSQKRGLTEKGRALVTEMEQRRMIVDLAHASPATIDDVLAIATRPILVSHTGVTATCDSHRNLTDDQIRRIARTSGLIGIAYFQAAVCGSDALAVVRAIRHVRDLVGVEHVALGSDFDGATRVPFTTSELSQITEALVAAGFSEDDIAKIMGGNSIRFLTRNLP